MKLTDSLSELRRLMQRTPRADENERLMQLYRNRVELKKEFSRLQEENYQLQQRLKKQDHSQSQVQQRLAQLEEYLGKPENGLPALVFYQLRALWMQASRRLLELNQELSTQQQERERRLQVMEFDQHRQRTVAQLESAMLDAQSHVDAVTARVQLIQRRMHELRWFWHYRRRRELRDDLHGVLREQAGAHHDLMSLQEQRDMLLAENCPEFPGLSVEGKRLVNTATLAYAQQLLERLGMNGLAPLSKDASVRNVLEMNYGQEVDCRLWLEKLHEALALLHNAPRDLQHLRQNTLRLRNNAFYRTDHDTVPVAESIGTVAVKTISAGEVTQAVSEEVNVLLDDYWHLYEVLLH
jgi:hypothetical protein